MLLSPLYYSRGGGDLVPWNSNTSWGDLWASITFYLLIRICSKQHSSKALLKDIIIPSLLLNRTVSSCKFTADSNLLPVVHLCCTRTLYLLGRFGQTGTNQQGSITTTANNCIVIPGNVATNTNFLTVEVATNEVNNNIEENQNES